MNLLVYIRYKYHAHYSSHVRKVFVTDPQTWPFVLFSNQVLKHAEDLPCQLL